MRTPRPLSLRRGRCNNGHVLVLVVLVVLATVAAIRLSTPEQSAPTQPLWDRILTSLVGLLQCFGLVIGACVLVASVQALKWAASHYRLRQVEKKLARAPAAPANSFESIRQSLLDLGLQVRVEPGAWRLSRPGSHRELVLNAPREGEVLSLDQLRPMLKERGLLREDEEPPGS